MAIISKSPVILYSIHVKHCIFNIAGAFSLFKINVMIPSQLLKICSYLLFFFSAACRRRCCLQIFSKLMTDVRPKPVCITALKQKLGESVLTIEKLETLIKETGPSNVSFFLSPMALCARLSI